MGLRRGRAIVESQIDRVLKKTTATLRGSRGCLQWEPAKSWMAV